MEALRRRSGTTLVLTTVSRSCPPSGNSLNCFGTTYVPLFTLNGNLPNCTYVYADPKEFYTDWSPKANLGTLTIKAMAPIVLVHGLERRSLGMGT